MYDYLAGGFQIFLMFIPSLGKMNPFYEQIFPLGWFNHQPVTLPPIIMVQWNPWLYLKGNDPIGDSPFFTEP